MDLPLERRRLIVATLSYASILIADEIRDFRERNSRNSKCLDGFKNPLSKKFIADLVGGGHTFVSTWSKVDIFDAEFSFTRLPGGCPKRKLSSPASQKIIHDSSNKRFKSSAVVARELRRSPEEVDVSAVTVWRERRRLGYRPFKQFRVLLLTSSAISGRIALCAYTDAWPEEQWLRLAFSDEFYVWASRKHNGQNHRIWSTSRDDAADILAHTEIAHPVCIGVYLCFTGKKLIWEIKEQGCSWTGDYYRRHILHDITFPMLSDQKNLVGPVGGTKLWHDNASMHRAKATQAAFHEAKVDFFPTSGSGRVPPYSADINPAENLGSIMMEEVEESLEAQNMRTEAKTGHLIQEIEKVLKKLSQDTGLLTRLVGSFRQRIALLKERKGLRLKRLN